MKIFSLCAALGLLAESPAPIQEKAESYQMDLVSFGKDGKLVYRPYTDVNPAAPSGDVVLDFSNCGYRQGAPLPEASVIVSIDPSASGDDTERIQDALNQIANKPLGADGFRGAILLRRGEYRIAGTLRIGASGIVLRGEGDDERGTILRATGNKVRNLIVINGGSLKKDGAEREITDTRVPVGARSLTLDSIVGLKVGQPVIITRKGNAQWISLLGMDRLPPKRDGGKLVQWTPFTLSFDRVITAIVGNVVYLDAPISCDIDRRWGGGSLAAGADDRIENIGIEKLQSISDYDPTITAKIDNKSYHSDESHASHMIAFQNVKNAWARKITTKHYIHGPVRTGVGGKWLTIAECQSLSPVSIITIQRRSPFLNSGAQLCLFRDLYSDHGRHAFVYGSQVVGPNVFLRCRSTNDHAKSEPHMRWSVGGLYDNCSVRLSIVNRGNMGSGHGWSGANFVAWNCSGDLSAEAPPTAMTAVIGHQGAKIDGPFKTPGAVIWQSDGKPVAPQSLYEQQLLERLKTTQLNQSQRTL
jgi:hypothetical protein